MLTWLQIIFYILVNIPKFISIIKQILELIHNVPKGERVALRDKISEAIKVHKQDKDDEKLHKVLCEGVACVSAPVKDP